MGHPRGLECSEHFCRYHKEDVCTGYDYQWRDCPRALAARLEQVEKAGGELAEAATAYRSCMVMDGGQHFDNGLDSAIAAWLAASPAKPCGTCGGDEKWCCRLDCITPPRAKAGRCVNALT